MEIRKKINRPYHGETNQNRPLKYKLKTLALHEHNNMPVYILNNYGTYVNN